MLKDKQISIRISDEDRESMRVEAEALGLSLASYLLYLHKMHVANKQ